MSLESKIKNTKKIKPLGQQTKEIKKYDLFLLKYSKVVDNVDMFLGPFSEIAKYSESELIAGLGVAFTIIEGLVKIPFLTCYLTRTKDYAALYDWVPKEIFSCTVPMGSFIDILRSYEKITFMHYGLKPFKEIQPQLNNYKSIS